MFPSLRFELLHRRFHLRFTRLASPRLTLGQAGFPHCICVRTVERELLLRCSSDAEAETWRIAILGKSNAPLSVERLSVKLGTDSDSVSLPGSRSKKESSDSIMAEDGDSLDLTGISLGHRFLTESVSGSTKSSLSSNAGGAIPGYDGKKNSIGCVLLEAASPWRMT